MPKPIPPPNVRSMKTDLLYFATKNTFCPVHTVAIITTIYYTKYTKYAQEDT